MISPSSPSNHSSHNFNISQSFPSGRGGRAKPFWKVGSLDTQHQSNGHISLCANLNNQHGVGSSLSGTPIEINDNSIGTPSSPIPNRWSIPAVKIDRNVSNDKDLMCLDVVKERSVSFDNENKASKRQGDSPLLPDNFLKLPENGGFEGELKHLECC